MRQTAACLLVLSLSAAAASAAEGPTDVVESYFYGYSAGEDTSVLVERYWLPTVIIFPAGAAPVSLPAAQFATTIDAFRKRAREQGIGRGEIGELVECRVRDDLSMVSFRYTSQSEDGEESVSAVVYTVVRAEGWRIASVTPTDADVLIGCASP